jgi:rod shape-determining protein MreD
MSLYYALPSVILLALAQSTLAERVQLFGVSPNLTLVFVIAWVLVFGLREGMIVALAGGLVLDALSAMPFGLSIIALLVVSWLAGMGQTNVFRNAWFLPYVTIVVATLVFGALLIALLQLGGRPMPWGVLIWRILLPEMTFNLICTPILYPLVAWLHKRARPEVVEWQ